MYRCGSWESVALVGNQNGVEIERGLSIVARGRPGSALGRAVLLRGSAHDRGFAVDAVFVRSDERGSGPFAVAVVKEDVLAVLLVIATVDFFLLGSGRVRIDGGQALTVVAIRSDREIGRNVAVHLVPQADRNIVGIRIGVGVTQAVVA